ncbi:hypothetical protein OAP44_01825 [Candidatus Pelagibacter sp.]|nr:hypothetical protein [Candidatus Pelagibacter sp.]
MAVTEQISRPAPFVEKLGTNLAENVLAQQGTPIVTGGLGSISQLAGEDAGLFAARQKAAQAFDVRKQSLAGLAPQVAGQDALQTQAQNLATQGVGSFEPFLQQAQTAGTAAGTALSGVGLGATAYQQGVQDFMSPYQSQVIDASLAEFDRNTQIQQQGIRDQQAALGALGSGRAGVQLAEYGTGAARERALLQAGLLQQGFGQAAGARQQDIANRGAFASQQQGLGAFQSGLGQTQQAATGVDISRLGQLGALNQAQTQAGYDATREATRQAAFQPQEQLDRYASQVTGIMGGYPGQTVSTNVPNPTPLQTALGVGTTLAGIYGGLSGKTNFNFGATQPTVG